MAQLKETSIKNLLKIAYNNDSNNYLYLLTNDLTNKAAIGYTLNGTKKNFITIDNDGNGMCELSNKAKKLNQSISFNLGDGTITTDFSSTTPLNFSQYLVSKTNFTTFQNTLNDTLEDQNKRIEDVNKKFTTLDSYISTTLKSDLKNISDKSSSNAKICDDLLHGLRPMKDGLSRLYYGMPLISLNRTVQQRVAGLYVNGSNNICVISESNTHWINAAGQVSIVASRTVKKKVGKKTKNVTEHKGFVFSDPTNVSAYNAWTKQKVTRVYGHVTTALTKATSDIRLKENIQNSKTKGLKLINKIKLREFDWIAGKHQKIGFIADELEKLDSNLTIGGGYDKDGVMNIKTIDILYLQAYEVKAIQELSKENFKLKNKLYELEKRLSQLENK